eukprot:Gb_11735 [translate_table: standard]
MGSSRTMLSQPLQRQNSLYNLTLEEAQNQLGYAIGSMNIDELLNNIWIQENQAMAISNVTAVGNPSLQPQGSLTLPKTLSHKTVEEVWKDIQRNQMGTSFAEMTLEDFLVKAGVVREDSQPLGNNSPAVEMEVAQNPQHAEWYQYQQQQQHLLQQHQPAYSANAGGAKGVVPQSALGIPANPELLDGYTDVTVGLGSGSVVNNSVSLSSPMMGTSSNSPFYGKKRGSENMIDKTMQRRQKRMIKNRESAARSRARKQAYTNELENEVTELKEENARLKRQKFLEKLLPAVPHQPKRVLRRASSAPF